MEDVLHAKPTLSWQGVEMVAFGPFGMKGAPDHFFRNDSRHASSTRRPRRGCRIARSASGSPCAPSDFDDDGDIDVYVANDSDPNYLYRNEGNGHFKEIGTWSFSAFDENGAAQASMGVAFGDVDGDGVPDLFVTNFSEDFSTLYKGLGDGLFEDVREPRASGRMTFRPCRGARRSPTSTTTAISTSWSPTGTSTRRSTRTRSSSAPTRSGTCSLENRGAAGATPMFRDVTGEAGPGLRRARASSRGLAVGDYDNDGRLDLLITHLDRPPELLHNEGARRRVAHRRHRGPERRRRSRSGPA